MAKYINNRIKSGKVAGSVYAVRYGEVIERAYNPYVSNPQTAGQVATRAKLKLISQLSAVMAPAVAMPRIGAVSARNRFMKVNYPAMGYEDSKATIDLVSVKLTDSVVGMNPIRATRGTGNLITASVIGGDAEVSRVVFVQVEKQTDEVLRYRGSVVVERTEGSNSFEAEMFPADLDTYIYAYGVRDNNDRARAIYGNLEAPTAEDIAQLVVSRTLTESDITLTETRATEVTSA